MKKRSTITILLIVLLIIPTLISCSSKDGNYINPKLTAEKDSAYVGTMGKPLPQEETYSGYLGYGYNIVSKGYFNSGDVNTKSMILDLDALVKKSLVYTVAKSDTTTRLVSGSTVQEYQSDLSTKIGISYSYGLFCTSFAADFSIDTHSTTKTSSKNVYIKNHVNIQRERQFIDTSKMTISDLKKYVNPIFLDAINKDTSGFSDVDKNAYYESLFNIYGTHAMIDIILGGRMDLNYIYNNTESKRKDEILSEVNAAYSNLRSSVTGSVSQDIKTTAETFVSKTTFNGKRLGGSTAGNMLTYQDAVLSYKEWAESIEASHTLELIDVGDNCYNSLIGIWEFADESNKQEIAKAYDYYLSKAGQLFADFDARNSAPTPVTTYYIKDIYVGINANSKMAISDAESQISHEDPNILYTPLSYDLNKGVKGDYIYLVYTYTTDPAEAITDIKVEWWNKESNAPATYKYGNNNYTCLKKDLNSGAGGKYIYLYYTKEASAGAPLKEIGVETDGTYSFGSSAAGWTSVIGLTESAKADCNKGSGGPYLYLWYRR